MIRLNEKDVPLPTATPSIEISKTQPNTSENEISETSEEEPEVCDKTASNTIIDIQTPTLQIYHIKIYEHRKI